MILRRLLVLYQNTRTYMNLSADLEGLWFLMSLCLLVIFPGKLLRKYSPFRGLFEGGAVPVGKDLLWISPVISRSASFWDQHLFVTAGPCLNGPCWTMRGPIHLDTCWIAGCA